MFKLITFFLVITLCKASIIKDPMISPFELQTLDILPSNLLDLKEVDEELWDKWGHHLLDFFALIDINKLLPVVMSHMDDPDVMNLIQFVGGDEFKHIVKDTESIEEFQEGINYLQSKGFKAQEVIEIINSEIDLENLKESNEVPVQFGNGITNIIEELLPALPIDEIKDLLKKKIHNEPEFLVLFATITSEDFKDIVKRMSENPKTLKIKKVIEGHGFDFQRLRALYDKIVGDFFVGLFAVTDLN